MTEEEFLSLFDRYQPMVYALALSYTRSDQDAEGVCQSVFLRPAGAEAGLPRPDPPALL